MIELSDRTKDLIIKTLIVVELILLFMVFPGSIFLSLVIPSAKIVEGLLNTSVLTFLGVGILYMILLPIFGGLKQKPVKAEKLALPFTTYECFLEFLQKMLPLKGYHMQKEVPFSSNGEVMVYVKPSKLWLLECFTIVRVPELSDELIEIANESVTNILTEYYGGKTITDTIDMISVFCVDRTTPALHKLVNSNVQQGFKNGRLPVGISFGGKNIYIAKQKDGFAIAKYKRLRREFIDILRLPKIDK